MSGRSFLPERTVSGRSYLPERTVFGRSFLPERTVSGRSFLPERTVSGRSFLPERTVSGRSFLPERTFAVRRSAMGRTSAPRRCVAVLWTATRAGRGAAAKYCSASRTYLNRRLHPPADGTDSRTGRLCIRLPVTHPGLRCRCDVA